MNKDLETYITQQRTAGFTDEQISAALRTAGYSEADVVAGLQTEGIPTPPPPQTTSQTGSADSPIQVENVQYTVDAKKYNSKPGFIFKIANVCIAVSLFMLATTLYSLTGSMVGDDEAILTTMQFSISVLIPFGVIGFIAVRRLYALFASTPEAIEDIKFKTSLRRSFRGFLILASLGSVIAVFNFIGLFMEFNQETIMQQFLALYYVGGLIVMCGWLYSLQAKTKR